MISAVLPEDIPEEDPLDDNSQEGALEAPGTTGADLREPVISEAHPALAAGGEWVEALEAEDFMAEASAEVAAEDPAISSTHRAHHERKADRNTLNVSDKEGRC